MVKVGYKQTRIGEIPDDWKVIELKGLTSEISDGIHTTPIYSDNGKYYFVNGNNLSNGGIIFGSETKKASIAEFQKHRRNLSDRSILLSINGTIGNLAFYADEPIILGKSAAYLNIQHGVSKQYIYFSLQTDYVTDFFDDALTGTTIRNLGLGAIRETPIALPTDVSEQQAISEALTDVDGLIEALDRLIAKKRDIKTGTMQQLLTGKKRLPGFEGEWLSKAFGQCCHPRKERTSPQKLDDAILSIELENIGQGSGRILGSVQANQLASIKTVFYPDDILFGKLRSYLRKFWLAERQGVCSTEIWALVVNKSLAVPLYLYQIVQSDLFIEAASEAYGTHMPRADWKVVGKFEVRLPPLKEQCAIAGILSEMDAEIAVLEEQQSKMRLVKQGMMQELLTGRTRLV